MKQVKGLKIIAILLAGIMLIGCGKDKAGDKESKGTNEYNYEEKNIPPMITHNYEDDTVWAIQPGKEKVKLENIDTANVYQMVYIDYNNTLVYKELEGDRSIKSINLDKNGEETVIATQNGLNSANSAGVEEFTMYGTEIIITEKGITYYNGVEEKVIYEGEVEDVAQVNNNNVAILTAEYEVLLWNGHKLKKIENFGDEINKLSIVNISADNKYFAAFSYGNEIIIYDIETDKKMIFKDSNYVFQCQDKGFVADKGNQVIFRAFDSETDTVIFDGLKDQEVVSRFVYEDGYIYFQLSKEYTNEDVRVFSYGLDNKELKEVKDIEIKYLQRGENTVGILSGDNKYYEFTKSELKEKYSDVSFIDEYKNQYIIVDSNSQTVKVGDKVLDGKFLTYDYTRVYYTKDNKNYYYNIETKETGEYGEGYAIKFGSTVAQQ